MEQRMETRIRENVVINKTHKTSPSCTTHQSIRSINCYFRAVLFVRASDLDSTRQLWLSSHYSPITTGKYVVCILLTACCPL